MRLGPFDPNNIRVRRGGGGGGFPMGGGSIGCGTIIIAAIAYFVFGADPSQFLGGAFCLAIAVSLTMGSRMTAVVLEGFLIAGTVTMLAGFCVGTFVFHLLRGHVSFAMRTLPWAANG